MAVADMGLGYLDYSSDMSVVKTVIDVLALAARLDDIIRLENGELMGDGGFGHAESLGKVAHADLLIVKRGNYTGAGGIAENLEEICHAVKLLGREHFVADSFDLLRFEYVTFAFFFTHNIT